MSHESRSLCRLELTTQFCLCCSCITLWLTRSWLVKVYWRTGNWNDAARSFHLIRSSVIRSIHRLSSERNLSWVMSVTLWLILTFLIGQLDLCMYLLVISRMFRLSHLCLTLVCLSFCSQISCISGLKSATQFCVLKVTCEVTYRPCSTFAHPESIVSNMVDRIMIMSLGNMNWVVCFAGSPRKCTDGVVIRWLQARAWHGHEVCVRLQLCLLRNGHRQTCYLRSKGHEAISDSWGWTVWPQWYTSRR